MRIHLSSIPVDDQDKALRFYTEVLGFEKKEEVPLGEHRWLTVVSPEEPNGTELVLEPDFPSRGQAVQSGARQRRNPVHILGGRRGAGSR
jgi:catechol 2,3-dioxygenase-like lactoylglutathione lyase family enzyme